MTEDNPHFPPEIEYQIFIFAFHNDLKGRAALLRVAKRVDEWLKPLLYDTIMISDILTNFESPPLKSFQRHGHHIHHLFVVAPKQAELDLLLDLFPLCPNVSNLGMWFGTIPIVDILALPVRRLAIAHFGFLQEKFSKDPNDIQFLQWCSNITHLAIGQELYEASKRCLECFTALEYLMIPRGDDHCGFVRDALRRCRRLKVAILLTTSVLSYFKMKPEVLSSSAGGAEDIRVVAVDAYFIGDWYGGTQGSGDMWELAEKEVEMRRRMARS